MSLATRLSKIETEIKKSKGKVFIRLANSDGSYQEEKEDRKNNEKVIAITSEGLSSEELRSWAL